MRIFTVIVAASLLAGCTTPPPRLSQDPILNWFHVGQTKGEVRVFFESLGFSSNAVQEAAIATGGSTTTFTMIVPARRHLPESSLGTFMLTFSESDRLVSGVKLKD
jgi:hypothetical protein